MNLLLLALAPIGVCAAAALAQDTLKVAIGQINNWENQPPTLGQDAGFYKKYNLTLENFGTAGAGETLQAVISGSADIGGGVGVGGVLRAYSKGAPVRIILPSYTGTSDLYWYVKAGSPIKSLKDATDKNTIAYSTNGSSVEQHRRRLRRRTWVEGEADCDRGVARHVDLGDVQPGRYRLGCAAVRRQGNQRG